MKAEVHRLIVTNSEQQVKGIISLSDILKHLVLISPIFAPQQAPLSMENILTSSTMEDEILGGTELLTDPVDDSNVPLAKLLDSVEKMDF